MERPPVFKDPRLRLSPVEAQARAASPAPPTRAPGLALLDLPRAAGRAPGMVHLVGAGPGDPELLTLRALRLLQAADAVVYDRLVGPEILDFARRDAERIPVGKAPAARSARQEDINALLIRLARAGRRVVRLKGGDPFVFGRGGEELEALESAGVRVDVVPGITAATGCAAAARMALTHRERSGAVTFLSGHGKDGLPAYDWPALARGTQTLVIYMGRAAAETVARRLMAHGMDPATPAAVIENGTLATQRIRAGTVSRLADLAAAGDRHAPALIVIGEVARSVREQARPRPVAAPFSPPTEPDPDPAASTRLPSGGRVRVGSA